MTFSQPLQGHLCPSSPMATFSMSPPYSVLHFRYWPAPINRALHTAVTWGRWRATSVTCAHTHMAAVNDWAALLGWVQAPSVMWVSYTCTIKQNAIPRLERERRGKNSRPRRDLQLNFLPDWTLREWDGRGYSARRLGIWFKLQQ